jgi:hypothetical protein
LSFLLVDRKPPERVAIPKRSLQHPSNAPNGASTLKPRAKRSVALGYLENTVRRPERAICRVHFAPSGQRDWV